MPDILFIANLVPYPLDSGGKIKTFTSMTEIFLRSSDTK